jgi:hypothetical protein
MQRAVPLGTFVRWKEAKMRTELLALMSVVVLAAAPVQTESPLQTDSRAGSLLTACTSASQSRGDLLCNAYINGFVHGILIDQAAREQGAPICVDNTTTMAVRQSFISFLASRPDMLYLGASAVLGVVLQSSYPCHQ